MADYKCYVLTNDLDTAGPIAMCEATCDEELFGEVEMWCVEAALSEESKQVLVSMRLHAHAPNDGLLGTSVTELFTLPELMGLRIRLQFVDY